MAQKAEHPVILIDDWNHELDIDQQFVGRHREIKSILKALHDGFRLFGIFGIRAVGKSRLVKELISRYLEYETDQTIIRLDLLNHGSIRSILRDICLCLGNEIKTNDTCGKPLVLQIEECVQAKQKPYIFFLDNLENVETISNVSILWDLANSCKNVHIFITSTIQIMFDGLQNICFSIEILPLDRSESAELFKQIAPFVSLGEYEKAIVKFSEGLPLLISMIANEMADDNGRITSRDMLNMLSTSRLKCLSRMDFYGEEDRIADVYRKFIQRLRPDDIRQLTLLGYIPGSFDTVEAREILGFQSNTAIENHVLIPIRRRCMLTYDAQTGRFNMQDILRECLEVYFALKNITEVRKRFVKVFSMVMSELCMKLGTVEYVKAMSMFSLEQPNLQKLLTEINYTEEDTYQFFKTIATSCTELIEQFKECDKFYKGCLIMTNRYGNDVDKAMVNIAVGSMWTNVKNDLLLGASYYKEALKVLAMNGNRLQLATLYQGLGWNLHLQGKTFKAVGYFRKSLNISQNGGPKFDCLVLQSLRRLGITNTLLGNYQEAEKYHFKALELSRATFTNNHPATGKTLNNIGCFFAAKEDSVYALEYYLEGLKVKRNTKAPVTSLVYSINNVANEYSALTKYVNAHKLLDEGFQLIQSQEMPSESALALLYNSRGKVFIAEKRYADAMDMFQKAVDIREVIIPEHIEYIGTLVLLAVAKKYEGFYGSSIRTAKKALSIKVNSKDQLPSNQFIADCYECLADIYLTTDNNKKYSDTLEHLQSELFKLEQVHMCSGNSFKVGKVRQQLEAINKKLSTINKKECQIETIYSRIQNSSE